MKKNGTITLYHGTTPKYAYKMAVQGFDSRKKHYRLYPHTDARGKKQDRGLYLTGDWDVARRFGSGAVVKVKVKVKDLYPVNYNVIIS